MGNGLDCLIGAHARARGASQLSSIYMICMFYMAKKLKRLHLLCGSPPRSLGETVVKPLCKPSELNQKLASGNWSWQHFHIGNIHNLPLPIPVIHFPFTSTTTSSGRLKNLGIGVDSRARPRETTIVVVPSSLYAPPARRGKRRLSLVAGPPEDGAQPPMSKPGMRHCPP